MEEDIRTSSSQESTLEVWLMAGFNGRSGRMRGTPWVEWHSSSVKSFSGVVDNA